MKKEIRSLYCPECGKKTRFENNPQSISAGGVLWKIFNALLWCIIPVIGWFIGIYCLITIFTDKKGCNKFYCCTCGTCVEVKK